MQQLAGDMLPAPEARVGFPGHHGQCDSPALCLDRLLMQ